MADLISREAALDLLQYYPIKNPEPTDIIPAVLETARKFIARLPAVDAVEVVRCKDCKYMDEAKVNSKGFLICPASGMEITDMDFCSYGERREENAAD